MAEVKDPFWAVVESFGVDQVFVLPEWVKKSISEKKEPISAPEGIVAGMAFLENQLLSCQECKLAETRKNVVFGTGNPESGILVVGDNPGTTEDETGKSFTGEAGLLFDKILGSVDLNREKLFITDMVKCHSINNRVPSASETASCSKFLEQQIAIMNPGIIIALGAVVARTLLNTKTGIGLLREGFHSYKDIPVLVTYHPSALLRSPALKRPVWEDMKKLRAFLETARLPRESGE